MRTWEDDARDHVRRLLTDAITAVTPQVLVRSRVRTRPDGLDVPGARLDFAGGGLRLAAVGKAAPGLAAQASVWAKWDDTAVLHGAHPVPDDASVRAGERLLELARATGPQDTLVLLVSGGASAMVEVPEVPLPDLRRVTSQLLAAGATIHATNCVRKHLSAIKGGRLAAACRGRVVSLVLSDVPGDDLAVVGGGLGVPDQTTFKDALGVLAHFHLLETAPPSVVERFEAGAAGRVAETPKHLPNATAALLGSNTDAVDAAHRAAKELGYQVVRVPLGGEARAAGLAIARGAANIIQTAAPVCVIAGGETTVRVTGGGQGGRNQELVLGAVEHLAGRRQVLASLATDGVDGPTDAAGALADGRTLARARALGLDVQEHLLGNDAYGFFEPLDDLIETGPTGTNVADVAVCLTRG